jgi:cytochrome c biogenesis protein CcdA
MKHILLGIVLIVVGIGLAGARVARSSVASRRGSAAVSTTTSEMTWVLPVAGVVLVVLGVLLTTRVF